MTFRPLLINILMLIARVSFANTEVFVPIGFDPGLTKELAATLDPKSGQYIEKCAGSPTKKCYGTIPSGGGFYTINEFNWCLFFLQN